MPVAGTRSSSGSDSPLSSILISFEAALTLVAMLLRPFLSVRPSYSSFSLAGRDDDLVGRLVALVALVPAGLLRHLDRDVAVRRAFASAR